ncbi:(R,R)-butanediol dehydrogenase [Cyphellophora attinorum]|uniref:(R,R)-butanediol dehydrogenase n=1 Tax=Cyphellophora attinorum TaxID=1664694 RepID=A0A0N0NLY8_9EURO|nr:(R,R)-butanediol dehydrogenase [Phialophora attinorum]KPI39589.1 (R,R)-butanediol dehydrogenase [Phialophora attinorum]
MRALRYHAPGDLRVDTDVPEPKCQPHQLKIKPAFVGICGTDLHEYSTATFVPIDTPHPLTGEKAPVGVGHEFSGTITEVGSEVKDGWKVGDKVAVQPTLCCWSQGKHAGCDACDQSAINICSSGGFVGLSGGGGGVSDFVCIDSQFAFKLPSNVDLDVGALVEPLAVAWHAVDQYELRKGDAALVLGAGPIGLSVIQCLKARGAETIIVAEVAAERKAFAKHFGATHIVDPTKEDVAGKAKEITGGKGVDVALDCAGVAASIKSEVAAVRVRGTVVNVAIWEKEVPVQPNWFVFGEKSYKAVLGYLQKDFAGVVKALGDGKLQPTKMITSKIRVDRVVEDGYNALINEKDKHVKILIDVQGS